MSHKQTGCSGKAVPYGNEPFLKIESCHLIHKEVGVAAGEDLLDSPPVEDRSLMGRGTLQQSSMLRAAHELARLVAQVIAYGEPLPLRAVAA
jgi:hypothetical protein